MDEDDGDPGPVDPHEDLDRACNERVERMGASKAKPAKPSITQRLKSAGAAANEAFQVPPVPRMPEPSDAVDARFQRLISDVRARAMDVGISPTDPIYTLLEAMLELHGDVVISTNEHAKRVEALTNACGIIMETTREKARADVEGMALTFVERLRTALEADLSRAILRLPRQIGWLRASVVGIGGAALLGLGLAGGAIWEWSSLTASASAVRSVFVAGSPGIGTWLVLHQENDIDAALSYARGSGRCSIQAGREACDISLWTTLPPMPMRR